MRAMRLLPVLIAGLGLASLATEAAAGCPDSPSSAEVCTFTAQNFTGGWGTLMSFVQSNPCGNGLPGTYFHPRCFPPGVPDNGTQSIAQGPNTRTKICFDPNFSGYCFQLNPGWWYWSLGGWNNQISSYKVEYVSAFAAARSTAETALAADETPLWMTVCKGGEGTPCTVLKGKRSRKAGQPLGGQPSKSN
jgi:hypothetical protein